MTERKTMEEWRAEFRRRGQQDTRERVFAILDHPAAQSDYCEAKRLALETDMPAGEVIEHLQAREAEAVIERAREITEAGGGK